MKILVVKKSSNFEQHGEITRIGIEAGHLNQQDFDLLKSSHEQHYATLANVEAFLASRGIAFDTKAREGLKFSETSYDWIITVGGDGTLLSTSHQLGEELPILGVCSSDASVGYLCAGDRKNIQTVLEELVAGKLETTQVSRLKASIRCVDRAMDFETFPILNDFLFTNANPAATSRYRISLRNKVEFQKSSGLWISTAIGSTAAMLAAGGSPMELRDARFQFRVRELYRSENDEPKLVAGFFDGINDILEIENHSESSLLAIDGQHGIVNLGYADKVSIQAAPKLTIAVSRFRKA